MSENKKDFGSGFLYAEDFLIDGQFKQFDLVISDYFERNTLKSADGKPIDKPTIAFEKTTKRLVLCKSNESLLHFMTGTSDGKKWVGRKVTLAPRKIQAFGQSVFAIRVMPPPGATIRKGLFKQLGEKAVWVDPFAGSSTTKQ